MAEIIKAGVEFVAKDKASSIIKGIANVSATAMKAVVASAAAGGAALIALSVKSAKASDEVFKMANRLNLSTEAFSALRHVSKQAGATIDDLESAIGDLAQRSLNMPKDFKRWGIATKNVNGTLKTSEELLFSVADRIQSASSETERFALADELMSDAGRRLLPVLREGSEALREHMEEVERLGGVVTKYEATVANEFIKTQGKVETAISGAGRAISTVLLPFMTALNEGTVETAASIREWVQANDELISEKIMSGLIFMADHIVPAIATGFSLAGRMVLGTKLAFETLMTAMAQGFQKMGELLEGVGTKMVNFGKRVGDESITKIGASIALFGVDVRQEYKRTEDGASDMAMGTIRAIAAMEKALEKLSTGGSEKLRQIAERTRQLIQDMKTAKGELGGGGGGDPPDLDAAEPKDTKVRLPAFLGGFSAGIAAPTEKEKTAAASKDDALMMLYGLTPEQLDEAHQTFKENQALAAQTVAANDALASSYVRLGTAATQGFAQVGIAAVKGEQTAGEAIMSLASTVMTTAAQVVVANMAQTASTEAKQSSEIIGWPASAAVIPAVIAATTAMFTGLMSAFNKGGMVRGGTPGQDSVPALLTPGEFVLPKHVVDDIRRGRGPGEAPSGQRTGFARGGMVPNRSAPAQQVNVTFANLVPDRDVQMRRSMTTVVKVLSDLDGDGVRVRPRRLIEESA